MKRCSLELRLPSSTPTPSSFHRHFTAYAYPSSTYRQDMTVFYNGKLYVWDPTEFQARTIIRMASEEMGKERSHRPVARPPLVRFGLSFSVRRSLQRFLQRRKMRSQAAPLHPNPSSSSASS